MEPEWSQGTSRHPTMPVYAPRPKHRDVVNSKGPGLIGGWRGTGFQSVKSATREPNVRNCRSKLRSWVTGAKATVNVCGTGWSLSFRERESWMCVKGKRVSQKVVRSVNNSGGCGRKGKKYMRAGCRQGGRRGDVHRGEKKFSGGGVIFGGRW